MTNLIVNGGIPLSGTVRPSGNKNAVLPMMCASLLTDEKVTLTNVPDITDVLRLVEYFRDLGSDVEYDQSDGILTLQHSLSEQIKSAELPTGMRSAVLLIAPLLVRLGKVAFNIEAKGCALGVREIDPHISHLAAFGAKVATEPHLTVSFDEKPKCHSVWAEYASVTATATFAMIASVADGKSVLVNAASEPHVQALCRMLTGMGVEVSGIGTSQLSIVGVDRLKGTTQRVPDDHHEVATFLALGGVTGGRVTVETDILPDMRLILAQLQKLGLQFELEEAEVTVVGWTKEVSLPLTTQMTTKIEAAPWPYFPADLLPQAIGVSIGCKGDVLFWNKVYEGALGWCGELSKFGVRAQLCDPHRLVVFGNNKLRPAEVEAPYIIRVVVGLLIAAIQIGGESRILKADPIRRAHPDFVPKLKALGAEVSWE